MTKYVLFSQLKSPKKSKQCVKSVQILSFFLVCIFPYSVQIRENKDQKNSVFGHFPRSERKDKSDKKNEKKTPNKKKQTNKNKQKNKKTKDGNKKIQKTAKTLRPRDAILLCRQVRLINSLFQSQLIQVLHFSDVPLCQQS